jgi:hypothetical protein
VRFNQLFIDLFNLFLLLLDILFDVNKVFHFLLANFICLDVHFIYNININKIETNIMEYIIANKANHV